MAVEKWEPLSISEKDCDRAALTDAATYLTRASNTLRCVTGELEPVAEASARELDRFALALGSIATVKDYSV